MNSKGEKCVGAGREKSPSLTKVAKEMNEYIGKQIIVVYISNVDGKGYICLENEAFFDIG